MVANDDEEYFPRGGSSGRMRTKKNFVFEKKNQDAKEPKKKLGKRERKKLKQQKGQNSTNNEGSENEGDEGDESFKDYEAANLEEGVVVPRLKKVEPLAYHTLAEGMVTLCSVNTILSRSIKVSLPERLLCTIDLQDISTPLKEELASRESKSCYLNRVFQVGDFLACKIKSIKKKAGDTQVKATCDPAELNSDLDSNNVHVGSVFLGAVKSVEDHGYMIFSGISGLNAFLPFDNCSINPEGKKGKSTLAVGKLVWCKVVKSTASEGGKNVQVSTRKSDFGGLKVSGEGISEKSLLPGMKFDLTVTKHLGRDIEVSVKGVDTHGFIPHSHLRSIASIASDFNIGDTLEGAVLYKFPISNVAAFSLRAEPTSVEKQVLETGEVFERAEIVSHDKRGLGVRFERKGKTCYGIVSKRRMEGDLKGKPLEQLFPKGNHLKVVIIGYHHIDQLYSCSTENDLLSGKFLTMTQLREMVGKEVTVVVKEIKGHGAQVMIDNRTAFVPDNQVTDSVGSQPLKKLQVNSKAKGRILRVDAERNSVIVTLRPTLVNNKPLIDFAKATRGEAYYGSVSSAGNDKINVLFFNGLKTEISQENLILDSHKYKIGELVKCYVVKENGKRQPPKFSLVRHVDQMLLSIGETYKLIVKGSSQPGIECLLKEKSNILNVSIPLQLICDDEDLLLKVKQSLSPGTTVDGHLFCFDSHLSPIFTLRESVKHFFQIGGEKLHSIGFLSLKPKSIIPVIVSEEVTDGFYVSVPIPKYNGKVLVPKEVIRRYKNVNIGDVVWLSVKSVNSPDRKINFDYPILKTHEKELKQWSVSYLRSHLTVISTFSKFKPGDRVFAVATGVGNGCRLIDGKEGLVEAQNKSISFSKGQQLELMVLFEDLEKGTLHLTEWKDSPVTEVGGPSSNKKFATIFVSKKFFVGKSSDGSICFCPLVIHPDSSKHRLDLQYISRVKMHLIDLCHKDGDILIGVLRKLNLQNSPPGEEEAAAQVSLNGKSKKKKKRNRSLSNKPVEHGKKAKLTLVSSQTSEKSTNPSSTSSKSRRKKVKSKSGQDHLSESNPPLTVSHYSDISSDTMNLESPSKKLKKERTSLNDSNPLLITSEY